MEADKVPEKLKILHINPIEWPKVEDYLEDCILSAVMNACVKYGDNQYEVSKQIKVEVEAVLGGNWVVIVCPADQKTYNIHYTPAIVHNKGYQEMSFTFEYDNRRYLIFKT